MPAVAGRGLPDRRIWTSPMRSLGIAAAILILFRGGIDFRLGGSFDGVDLRYPDFRIPGRRHRFRQSAVRRLDLQRDPAGADSYGNQDGRRYRGQRSVGLFRRSARSCRSGPRRIGLRRRLHDCQAENDRSHPDGSRVPAPVAPTGSRTEYLHRYSRISGMSDTPSPTGFR